jgi:hypothetical protein
MKSVIQIAIFSTTLIWISASPVREDKSNPCPVFVLQRNSSSVEIEIRQVPAGSIQVFRGGKETGMIDIILPRGLGGSGSLIQYKRR